MDLNDLFGRLTNTINKYRPADPEPVVFPSGDEQQPGVIPNRSPRWQRSTKRIVVVTLSVLTLICLYFLRSMITPLIFSCLLIFYLRPLTRSLQKRTGLSWKASVLIVFGIFLILAIGLVAAGGFSAYGQIVNLFDLLNNSIDTIPDELLKFLGGETTLLGGMYSRFIDASENSQLNQQLQTLLRQFAGSVLSFVQSFSSHIGWFVFIYGFAFFIVWEAGKEKRKVDRPVIPGYEFDIEMGTWHLSLIWRRFLWGQAMLMLITLVVYTLLFFILRVRYAFILACAAALTQLIPYVGSFFAWTAVGLVALFQGTTIFYMQPFPYAILVVVLAFLIDKFKDGFIQPKFMAETLKVHPAAVLAAALICARTMGFLGIFLAAPLVATLKLVMRYIIRKLRDEDPWEGIETIEEPLPLNEYMAEYRRKCTAFFEKVMLRLRTLRSRVIHRP